VREQVEINAKYSGYIRRQQEEIERQKKMESFPLPPDMDYLACTQLRTEARLKLNEIRPLTLGQAARISGVSPSDIGALIMILKMNEKARK
jgi:tRNA uridine 5-carboxymethylaminomethyl modification enzyme